MSCENICEAAMLGFAVQKARDVNISLERLIYNYLLADEQEKSQFWLEAGLIWKETERVCNQFKQPMRRFEQQPSSSYIPAGPSGVWIMQLIAKLRDRNDVLMKMVFQIRRRLVYKDLYRPHGAPVPTCPASVMFKYFPDLLRTQQTGSYPLPALCDLILDRYNLSNDRLIKDALGEGGNKLGNVEGRSTYPKPTSSITKPTNQTATSTKQAAREAAARQRSQPQKPPEPSIADLSHLFPPPIKLKDNTVVVPRGDHLVIATLKQPDRHILPKDLSSKPLTTQGTYRRGCKRPAVTANVCPPPECIKRHRTTPSVSPPHGSTSQASLSYTGPTVHKRPAEISTLSPSTSEIKRRRSTLIVPQPVVPNSQSLRSSNNDIKHLRTASTMTQHAVSTSKASLSSVFSPGHPSTIQTKPYSPAVQYEYTATIVQRHKKLKLAAYGPPPIAAASTSSAMTQQLTTQHVISRGTKQPVGEATGSHHPMMLKPTVAGPSVADLKPLVNTSMKLKKENATVSSKRPPDDHIHNQAIREDQQMNLTSDPMKVTRKVNSLSGDQLSLRKELEEKKKRMQTKLQTKDTSRRDSKRRAETIGNCPSSKNPKVPKTLSSMSQPFMSSVCPSVRPSTTSTVTHHTDRAVSNNLGSVTFDTVAKDNSKRRSGLLVKMVKTSSTWSVKSEHSGQVSKDGLDRCN